MAKFDSLDEPFSLDGNWWIPAEPNLGQQIGTLTFELGKYITLTLDSILGLSDSQKIIQGKTRTGHHVLLLENDGRLNEFYPSLVLISEQEIPWNISKEINLLHLTARYTYLEDWVAVNPFQHDTEQNEETRITKASLRYTRPEEIVVPLDSLNAQIRFIPGIQQSLQKTKAEINYNIRVKIIANEPRPIKWLLEQLQHIQDLLALLIGEPVRKLRLATSFTVDLSNIEPCFGEVERTINIFHSIPIPSPTRNIHPVGILSAPMLGNRLPQVIASWFRPEWFELWKELGDIYFGVFYNVIREPRFEFLALMQVLESFHRGKLGGQYLSEKEYKPILQALVNAIPDNVSPEFKESLTKTLNYGYEYKLVTRLAELLDLIGEDLKQILEIDEEYIKWLVRTRNNLTHYGANKKSKKKKSFDSQKLMQAHGRLSHLILALILKEELAIPEEIIQDLLKNRRSVGKLY